MNTSMTPASLSFRQSLTCAALSAAVSIGTFSLVASIMSPLFVEASAAPPALTAAAPAAHQVVCRDEWLQPDANLRRPTLI